MIEEILLTSGPESPFGPGIPVGPCDKMFATTVKCNLPNGFNAFCFEARFIPKKVYKILKTYGCS